MAESPPDKGRSPIIDVGSLWGEVDPEFRLFRTFGDKSEKVQYTSVS